MPYNRAIFIPIMISDSRHVLKRIVMCIRTITPWGKERKKNNRIIPGQSSTEHILFE